MQSESGSAQMLDLVKEPRDPQFLRSTPQGSKVCQYGVPMISEVGIVNMILGRSLLYGYLDPLGICLKWRRDP